MRISSEDIPQADLLEDVVSTINAVASGARTYQDIAERISKVGRQGRYYRKAAEVLGFINNYSNISVLTSKGESFRENPTINNPLLLEAVLETRIFQRLINYLEIQPDGVTETEIVTYLDGVVEPLGESMLARRTKTLLSWLMSLHVLEKEEDLYSLNLDVVNNVGILHFPDEDEPIFPHTGDLIEYETVAARSTQAQEAIVVLIDHVQRERANNAHQMLVNLVAERIRNSDFLPKANRLIDLATHVDENDYIFEMKSITERNARRQIRRGISQLYEYRYLQNIPDAELVLVLEEQIPETVSWMEDYVREDRGIWLLWDGDGELNAPDITRERLHFLW